MAKFPAALALGRWWLVLAGVCMGSQAWAGSGHDHSHGRHNTAAHVHGVGELEVVLDGNNLSIILYSPLHNVLGFEHTPRTDTEKVKARRVVSLLKANGLFAFSPEAQCKANGHKLHSDILNPHSHGPQDNHSHHDSSDGHSDVRAVYEFECDNPNKLKMVDVRIFRQFPAFQKIEVQALFPAGQTGASLTPGKTQLNVQ